MSIALLIVFGGLMVFNGIKSIMIKRFFAHYEAPAVTVSSVIAKEKDWEPSISAVGSFVAVNGVEVGSQTSGNVVAIHFNSGQYVKKGTPLIDLDDAVDQAMLKFNQSELTLQEINYRRQTDLLKRGATPTSSVDESQAKLMQAQAQVEQTEATIRQKHITAPFSGQLGIRQVNLGEYISPGQRNIVSLQSLDPLFLEFYLPEQLLKRLHLKQRIVFSVEQNPGLLFEGRITAINSRIDTDTHNILVQATVPNCPALALNNPQHSSLVTTKKQSFSNKWLVQCDTALNEKNQVSQFSFIPGMFAAIKIEQPVIPHTIVLPTTAISYSLYGDSVFVINKDPQGKKDKEGHDILTVNRAFVRIGFQEENYTTITSGIKAGQEVVSAGELKLQDGTRVIINNAVPLKDTIDTNTLEP